MEQDIPFFHRPKQSQELEKVYGGSLVRFLYKNPIGKLISPLFSSPLFSRFYGWWQDAPWSRAKVAPFISRFSINMDDYLPGSLRDKPVEHSFKSFNEFFVREFKEGKRLFVQGNCLPAFAEARYSGAQFVADDVRFPVKGKFLSARELLLHEKWYQTFHGGPILIARLCPLDYHRYHYPDDGKTLDHYSIRGPLFSVNPLALKARPNIFIQNERRVSILETKHFGKLAYIEVGATCVGKIVQTFEESNPFSRGQEKGLFLFGGSTVILLGEQGKWSPSQDILEYTSKSMEVFVPLGQEIALPI